MSPVIEEMFALPGVTLYGPVGPQRVFPRAQEDIETWRTLVMHDEGAVLEELEDWSDDTFHTRRLGLP